MAPSTSLRPGDNVTITASVTAQPLPQLKWFLNQLEISSSVSFMLTGDTRKIFVSNIRRRSKDESNSTRVLVGVNLQVLCCGYYSGYL